jgi:hypothetical protein
MLPVTKPALISGPLVMATPTRRAHQITTTISIPLPLPPPPLSKPITMRVQTSAGPICTCELNQVKGNLHSNLSTELKNAPELRSSKSESKSHDSSVGIAMGYGLDDRVLGFDSRRGLGIFLFTTASRTALRSTQPPIQWVLGALSLEIKWPGREADHSPPSSAEVKNAWSYTSTPIRLHGVVLS